MNLPCKAIYCTSKCIDDVTLFSPLSECEVSMMVGKEHKRAQ